MYIEKRLFDKMNSTPPTAAIPEMPDTSPEHLVMAKRKRNIILGSVIGGLVVVLVAVVLIYLFVFRPRVYYGNHILITTMQTPGSCTAQPEIPPPKGSDQQKSLPLQTTFNCDPKGDSKTPYLMPSGPLTRYTMISRSLQPYSSVGCAANIQMPCMLVTSKLGRSGLVHEQDAFMVWEPINNMYLYRIQPCSSLNKDTCVPGDGTTDPYGLCTLTNDTTCTLGANSVPIVFRPLPDNFQSLMADTNKNPQMKGFLFSFESKKPTKNMLRINQDYYMTSLVKSELVQFNVNEKRITLQDQPLDQTDDTFNWQILKE